MPMSICSSLGQCTLKAGVTNWLCEGKLYVWMACLIYLTLMVNEDEKGMAAVPLLVGKWCVSSAPM